MTVPQEVSPDTRLDPTTVVEAVRLPRSSVTVVVEVTVGGASPGDVEMTAITSSRVTDTQGMSLLTALFEPPSDKRPNMAHNSWELYEKCGRNMLPEADTMVLRVRL